jgi:diacylglycerol kinase (ATP)
MKKEKRSVMLFFFQGSIQSVSYAMEGISYLAMKEKNFQIHLAVTSVLIPMVYFLDISTLEWCLLLLTIGLVLGLEALNTSLEKLCDFISSDYQSAIKIIKDTAAGGVLISAFIAIMVGIALILPKILKCFSHES